ncbi:putative hemagglutinin/hemolysin-related protein [Streptococcus sp. DD11]|nr:putative hemagglutinin/hemolysin-related protein [Streptococcus sp. DD11]
MASGVTVIRKDRNGNILSAVYRPTVTDQPEQPSEVPVRPAPPALASVSPAVAVSQLQPQAQQAALPETGTKERGHLASGLLAAAAGVGLLGLAKRKKKSED